MLINYEINTDLTINNLLDLNKLKSFDGNNLKINKSEIARRLGKDRRTVNKYINGFTKKTKRNRKVEECSLRKFMISISEISESLDDEKGLLS